MADAARTPRGPPGARALPVCRSVPPLFCLGWRALSRLALGESGYGLATFTIWAYCLHIQIKTARPALALLGRRVHARRGRGRAG